MKIGRAIKCLKYGRKVRRANWPEGNYIFLNKDNLIRLMDKRFPEDNYGQLYIWMSVDLLAEDWEIAR